MDLNSITPVAARPGIDPIGPGDTVRVSYRVVEGNRERIQVFEGVVIRVREGGVDANFTVRRVGKDGIGVERTFLLHSPRLEKLEVTRKGKVRRANLYYLRGLTGKAARIKDGGRIVRAAPVAAPVGEVAAPMEDEVAPAAADEAPEDTQDGAAGEAGDKA